MAHGLVNSLFDMENSQGGRRTMKTLTTWRKEILGEMREHDESWDDVMHHTAVDLDKEFYAGFGCPEGEPFTLWTKKRVYFPTCHDGAEEAESVPRFPCDEITNHFGGW